MLLSVFFDAAPNCAQIGFANRTLQEQLSHYIGEKLIGDRVQLEYSGRAIRFGDDFVVGGNGILLAALYVGVDAFLSFDTPEGTEGFLQGLAEVHIFVGLRIKQFLCNNHVIVSEKRMTLRGIRESRVYSVV